MVSARFASSAGPERSGGWHARVPFGRCVPQQHRDAFKRSTVVPQSRGVSVSSGRIHESLTASATIDPARSGTRERFVSEDAHPRIKAQNR